eukprot:GHVL01036705.1.p1 GENE.GHVL01036705.1~~GHVL01036705.1.p1  ORF type:complete len:143 (-),score=26.84 GHVL01036705.1:39-467(-)
MDIISALKLDGEIDFIAEELKIYTNLKEIFKKFRSLLHEMPKMSQDLEVVYEFKDTGEQVAVDNIKYSAPSVMYSLREMFEWWRGQRNSEGVPVREKWKCSYCDYLRECSVCPLDENSKQNIIQERDELEALNSLASDYSDL